MAKKSINKNNFTLAHLSILTIVLIGISMYFLKFNLPTRGVVEGTGTGFDQFGYNYTARLFQGVLDGADRNLDGKYWGDAYYAKDRLVMKWSKAWDDARFHGAPWTPAAWTDNEYNGKVPGGSGEIWHYKIQWVGSCGIDGTPLEDGGYCIWGQFEVIFSQGTVGNEHFWDAHANPAGYGMF